MKGKLIGVLRRLAEYRKGVVAALAAIAGLAVQLAPGLSEQSQDVLHAADALLFVLGVVLVPNAPKTYRIASSPKHGTVEVQITGAAAKMVDDLKDAEQAIRRAAGHLSARAGRQAPPGPPDPPKPPGHRPVG